MYGALVMDSSFWSLRLAVVLALHPSLVFSLAGTDLDARTFMWVVFRKAQVLFHEDFVVFSNLVRRGSIPVSRQRKSAGQVFERRAIDLWASL